MLANSYQVIASKDREIQNLSVQQRQHQGGPGASAAMTASPVDNAPASGASSGLPSVYDERQGSGPSTPQNRPLSTRALEALASNKLGFIFGKPSFRTATVTAFEHEEGDVEEVSFLKPWYAMCGATDTALYLFISDDTHLRPPLLPFLLSSLPSYPPSSSSNAES